MLDPTSPEWKAANPTPSQAFLGLLWEQLCGGSTLDSWQLRAMNLSAVLREIVEICGATRSFPPLQRALGDVLDEAIRVSHRDPVLREHFRTATRTLEDPRLREPTSMALAHVEHTALHLLDTLRAYPVLLRRELEAIAGDSSAHGKKRLTVLADALATELHIHGFSRLFLHSFAERLVFSDFSAVLQDLLALLDRQPSRFRCIIPVSWPGFLHDAPLDHGSVRLTMPDAGSSSEVLAFKAILRPNDRFFVTEVEARDQFAAAQLATLTASRVLNLLMFYAPNRTLEIPRRRMLVQAGHSTFLVELDLAHESYIRDSRKFADKLLKTAPRAAELLAAPLQYHALGVQATAPESRLTNFWVALESLLVEQEGSIIDRVRTYIPPSLVLSRCHRLLGANAARLAAFIKASSNHELPEAAQLRALLEMSARDRVAIEPAALAQILLDDTRASKLFGLCARNPLLIYRLNQMRDQIRNPGELKRSLELHREGVSWQLGRIYRARNSLVHRGSLPPRAEHLIQHLHTYLSMTLHYLVREIGDSELLTVPAAFARRKALYDAYLTKITDRTLTFRNLTAEATCWQASTEPAIWPEAAAA